MQEQNSSFRLNKDALLFLQNMLALNAEINIVSRNRQEYIIAVLASEGLTPEQISKITISDITALSVDKYSTVYQLEQEAKNNSEMTVVCDDSQDDLFKMTEAIKKAGRVNNLVTYGGPPGAFNWIHLLEQMDSFWVTRLKKERPLLLPKETKDISPSSTPVLLAGLKIQNPNLLLFNPSRTEEKYLIIPEQIRQLYPQQIKSFKIHPHTGEVTFFFNTKEDFEKCLNDSIFKKSCDISEEVAGTLMLVPWDNLTLKLKDLSPPVIVKLNPRNYSSFY